METWEKFEISVYEKKISAQIPLPKVDLGFDSQYRYLVLIINYYFVLYLLKKYMGDRQQQQQQQMVSVEAAPENDAA